MGAEYSVSMVNVASPRGIDGAATIGRLPDLHQLCRAITVWVALSVGGVLDAREPQQRPIEAPAQAAVLQRVKTTEQQLSKWMKDLDDDEFAPRQGAWNAATTELWEAFDTEHSDADALLGRIKTDTHGRPRAMSAEQKARVEGMEKELWRWKHDIPQAFGQMGLIRGDEAMQLMQEKTGVKIGLHHVAAKLPALTVNLRGNRRERLVNNVLARVCNETKMKPWISSNSGIDLEPAKNDESIAWSPDLIGIVRRDALSGFDYVSLQLEPGKGSILALMDAEGEFAWQEDDDCCPIPPPDPLEEKETEEEDPFATVPGVWLDIARNHRPRYTGTFDGANLYTELSPYHPTHVEAVVADLPQSIELTLGGGPKKIGPQTISLPSAKEFFGQAWFLTCRSDIFEEIDWWDATLAWNALTYKLADANQYVVRDEDGKEMSATVVATNFRLRRMTVVISCPRKPASATVRAMTRFGPQSLELPRLPINQPAPVPAP